MSDVVGKAGEFEAWRGRLFGLAYRMLGSAVEAEDAVQDAYLRWERADREQVAAPGAWLAKVVTNLCLNRLASARARREVYVGQWLPEPVLTGDAPVAGGESGWGEPGPAEVVERREAVSLALLVLLERLTPPERAVFVLREAFGYAHREVAGIVGVSEAYARQLYRRAKQAVASSSAPAREPVEGARWGGLVEGFLAAARAGDLAGLERLLAEDVVSYADGGGKVGTARWPVAGRAKVARYLAGGLLRFGAGVDLVPAEVNGGPALLAFAPVASAAGGAPVRRLRGVLALEPAANGRIAALRICANPDKLVFLERQLAGLSHPGRLSGSS